MGNDRPHWVRLLTVLAGAAALWIAFPKPARCWEYSLFSDFDYQLTDSTIKNKLTGEKTKTQNDRFEQIYNLSVRHRLYPYLSLEGGGTFRRDTTTSSSEGQNSTDTFQSFQPFGGIRLNTPLLNGGLDYYDSQFLSNPAFGESHKIYRKEFDAAFGMKPVDLPSFSLHYDRIHTYDDPKTRDDVENDYRFTTDYIFRTLGLHYSYNRQDKESQLDGSTSLQQTHSGRLSYSHSLLQGRMNMFADYGIDYGTTENEGPQPQPVLLRPLSGLFAVDDTPEDGQLDPLGALNDSDTSVSAGINLGVKGNFQNVLNLGLDLGFESPLDLLYIYVQKRVDSSAANALKWSVYVSDRNDETSTWTAVVMNVTASFDDLDNRFEISIPQVKTRYIKVVVQPLSPEAQTQDILVTEMQALTVLPPGKNEGENMNQDASFSVNHRFSDKTSGNYTLSYRDSRDLLLGTKSYFLSNIFNINHTFNQVFSGSISANRADQWGTGNDLTTSYSGSSSLRARYSEVFSQTLLFSASTSSGEGASTRGVMLLRNQARPYRGWTVNLDGGYALSDDSSSGLTKTVLLRAASSVRPNTKLSFHLGYSGTFTSSGGDQSSPSDQVWQGQVFFSPVGTLSLSAGASLDQRDGERRLLQNYAANWAPFSSGDLQFTLAYNEFLSPTSDRETRQVSPHLTLRISRHFILGLAYNWTWDDSQIQEITSQSADATLRLIF